MTAVTFTPIISRIRSARPLPVATAMRAHRAGKDRETDLGGEEESALVDAVGEYAGVALAAAKFAPK